MERTHWNDGRLRIAGVDECGVACLSGPVVAAACVIPANARRIHGVRDSKMLTRDQREALFDRILSQALAVAIGAASVAEIERLNILNATRLAMQRALRRVGPYDHALIDGPNIRTHDMGPHTCIIDGDALCYAISCASVIGKVTRDRLMVRLSQRYPGYGWEHNAGYPTPDHRKALHAMGPTPHHRRTFGTVRLILQPALPFVEA
ncbi:MAG TPA: ribonuclease HII [Chloroflexota bacterium]|nr:ribonuclease HII [Chloroflexota bacterium]